jgi:hypothetical protein
MIITISCKIQQGEVSEEEQREYSLGDTGQTWGPAREGER